MNKNSYVDLSTRRSIKPSPYKYKRLVHDNPTGRCPPQMHLLTKIQAAGVHYYNAAKDDYSVSGQRYATKHKTAQIG